MSAPTVGPDRLLAVLRQHADDDGCVGTGLEVLADQLNYSTRQVERHLAQLRQRGQITHAARAGRRRPARYRLLEA